MKNLKLKTCLSADKVKNSRSGGFTIAEMLIVTIIIGILSTIGTRTYYTERNRFEFNNALTKTTGIIKTARNMATSSQAIYSNIAGKQIVPRNGYGVYINLEPAEDEPHFTLFASLGDENNDVKRFDKGVLSGPDLEADYIMETYRLPKQAEFHYFIYDNNVEWDNDLDPPAATATEAVIFFRPPLADTYVGSNATVAEDLEKLGMRFFNIYSNEGSSKACQTINLTRVQTFPIIEGSDCSEFTIEE
ncbi:type II secretion system protein [Candidatus Pacearchaeota archaeon]|nr:type II secretion system protein [Candidatus Pacearchaeota archaeon]